MANKEGVAANARIADTLIIALPIELTAEQRHDAIERFVDKIGKGRIARLAAFHVRFGGWGCVSGTRRGFRLPFSRGVDMRGEFRS